VISGVPFEEYRAAITDMMSENKNSNRTTGPQKLVSVFVMVARFGAPIQIVVFIVLANILARWLTAPIAHATAALLVFLPSYWLTPKRRIGFAGYAMFCIILAAGLALVEHLLLP
jgi:hypothetical protein